MSMARALLCIGLHSSVTVPENVRLITFTYKVHLSLKKKKQKKKQLCMKHANVYYLRKDKTRKCSRSENIYFFCAS